MSEISKGYSVESLIHAIEKANQNIKTFNEAIKKEEAMIEEFKTMINVIQRKEKEANAKITIETERDVN